MTELRTCNIGAFFRTHVFLFLLQIISVCVYSVPSQGEGEPCRIPGPWHGEWFEPGQDQHTHISASSISTKGRCLASQMDQFLIHHEENSCYRCMVILERHFNILQFKESNCSRSGSLSSLCPELSGTPLFGSLYRVGAPSVPCPFRGNYTFSYSKEGSGECKTSPRVLMDACSEEGKMIFSYQPSSNSTECESPAGLLGAEEMECLGNWKEGRRRYLVVRERRGRTKEVYYHCYTYSKLHHLPDGSSEYQLVDSGQPPQVLVLHPVKMERCKLPDWLSSPGDWQVLDKRAEYRVEDSNQSLRIWTQRDSLPSLTSDESHLYCSQLESVKPYSAVILLHYAPLCDFKCMGFYQRNQHVIEIQEGKKTRRRDEACTKSKIDKEKEPYTTLINLGDDKRQNRCPVVGRFSLVGHPPGWLLDRTEGDASRLPPDLSNGTLHIGCGQRVSLLLVFPSQPSSPNVTSVTEYDCETSWTEDGSHYLIGSGRTLRGPSSRRVCFTLSPTGEGFTLRASRESCIRPSVSVRHSVIFNALYLGQCGEEQNSTVGLAG